MIVYITIGTVMFAEWEGTEKRICYVTFPSTKMCVTLIIPLYLKGWNYVDSVYFCVTSLAKIGFGDFVPGQR